MRRVTVGVDGDGVCVSALSMLPSLREALMTTLDAECLTAQLKEK